MHTHTHTHRTHVTSGLQCLHARGKKGIPKVIQSPNGEVMTEQQQSVETQSPVTSSTLGFPFQLITTNGSEVSQPSSTTSGRTQHAPCAQGFKLFNFFFKLEPHLPPTASPAKSLQLRHQILLRVPSRLNQQPCEPHLNGHKRRSLGVWSHGCSGRTEYEIKRRVPCSSSENSSLRSCGWDRPPPKQKGQVAAALICFSLPRWRKLSVPFSASSTQGRSAEWSPW